MCNFISRESVVVIPSRFSSTEFLANDHRFCLQVRNGRIRLRVEMDFSRGCGSMWSSESRSFLRDHHCIIRGGGGLSRVPARRCVAVAFRQTTAAAYINVYATLSRRPSKAKLRPTAVASTKCLCIAAVWSPASFPADAGAVHADDRGMLYAQPPTVHVH